MVETVAARPTHYETLGIAPGASGTAIAEAFARELRKPRRFGDLGRISTAFETLSDPIRREAYDASLGLTRRPRAVPTSGRVHASFLCPPAPFVQERAAPTPVLPVEPAPAPAAPAEPEWKPELATIAPLRIVETPSPRVEPRPLATPRPRDSAQSEVEAWAAANRGNRYSCDETDSEPNGLLRTGLTVGGLVAGVVLIGAWAGWESGNDEPLQLQQVAQAADRPAPSPASDESVEVETATADVPESVPVERRQAPDAKPAEVTRAPAETEAIDPTEETAAAVTSASMPLPYPVVARTIDRIGYDCGKVASASAVDGAAPGVFKVTCSSGQSFQATPVAGRYRFRRL